MGEAVALVPVPTEYVPHALPRVAAKLRAVYAKVHMWMPFQILVEHLLEGKMQLWFLMEDEEVASVVCTRMYVQYGIRMAEITLYSGVLNDEMLAHLSELEKWARDNGAEAIRVEGLDGWRRVLAKRGYALEHVALFKLLEDTVS